MSLPNLVSKSRRVRPTIEINAEQLAETTMNPEKRTLLQVRLEDAVESEEVKNLDV
jgi:DNA gyrase/topoisomerase IV subunit B